MIFILFGLRWGRAPTTGPFARARNAAILTTCRSYDTALPSLLIEGRLPETVHRRSEVWRPAAAARNRSVREARESARQAIRPAPRGARCTRCGGNAADGSADPEPKNRHGGAPRGERPASWDAGRLASAWSAASWRAERVRSAASVRLSALRPPLRWAPISRPRAQSRRGNEVCCVHGLFDIVRREVRRMSVSVIRRFPRHESAANGSRPKVGTASGRCRSES